MVFIQSIAAVQVIGFGSSFAVAVAADAVDAATAFANTTTCAAVFRIAGKAGLFTAIGALSIAVAVIFGAVGIIALALIAEYAGRVLDTFGAVITDRTAVLDVVFGINFAAIQKIAVGVCPSLFAFATIDLMRVFLVDAELLVIGALVF
ncbi:MAG: hypothetical protein MJ060_04120 [Clostridia bacterium]|nr:hypothetical protein [Clostridia bacterium]